MKAAVITILILAGLIVGGGLLIDSIADSNSPSLLSAVSNKQQASLELKNYGPAPEFTGIEHWLNSDPLTMQDLRGKVVLIDFWTYSCINCIRTLPYVTSWDKKYQDAGLVIVGVHTPEFAFEKDTANVQAALKRHAINYPVAQDNNFGTWTAYSNRYWPAHYLIDQNGNLVYYHFGEGQYQETEQAIQKLLGLDKPEEMMEEHPKRQVKTAEIYLGLQRMDKESGVELEGAWERNDESARMTSGSGRIKLNFYAKDVHMVARGEVESEVRILVDGKLVNTVTVRESKLYTLFEGMDSGQRTLELEINDPGFEAYTFTFG